MRPGRVSCAVTSFRIGNAARLLGVSDDTVRRWVDAGRLETLAGSGPLMVDGSELAQFAAALATETQSLRPGPIFAESARNRFTGLVTKVTKDTVMAQVDIQAGPFRVVSLMSSEAATELGLEPGVLAVASVKSTNVVIEVPSQT